MKQRTITELANRAIIKIGGGFDKKTLENVETDVSDIGILCRILIPQVRREVLNLWDWQESIKYADLGGQVATDTAKAEWQYAFNLPADNIRVIAQIGEQDHRQKYDYQEFAGLLFTNDLTNKTQDSAYIKYIFDNEDVNTYSPSVWELMTLKLAAELAANNNPKSSISQRLKEEFYNIALPFARAANQKKQYVNDTVNNADRLKCSWLKGRRGGRA
jgi:hypothetical protein